MTKITLADFQDFLREYQDLQAESAENRQDIRQVNEFLDRMETALKDPCLADRLQKSTGVSLNGKTIGQRLELVISDYQKMAEEYSKLNVPEYLASLKDEYRRKGAIWGGIEGVLATGLLGLAIYAGFSSSVPSPTVLDAGVTADATRPYSKDAPSYSEPDAAVAPPPVPPTPPSPPSPPPPPPKPPPRPTLNFVVKGASLSSILMVEGKEPGKAYVFPSGKPFSVDVLLQNFKPVPEKVQAPKMEGITLTKIEEHKYNLTGNLALGQETACKKKEPTICGTYFQINISTDKPNVEKTLGVLITK